MAAEALYATPEEEAAHAEAIAGLAQEARRPYEEVRAVYEQEFSRLKEGASVETYLVLLSRRRAREALGLGRTSWR